MDGAEEECGEEESNATVRRVKIHAGERWYAPSIRSIRPTHARFESSRSYGGLKSIAVTPAVCRIAIVSQDWSRRVSKSFSINSSTCGPAGKEGRESHAWPNGMDDGGEDDVRGGEVAI